MIAICQLRHETVRRVLAVCVRCPCAHVQGWNSLMHAAWFGEDTEVWKNVVDMLLEKTKDVNQRNGKGMKSEHFLFSSQYVSRCSKRLK